MAYFKWFLFLLIGVPFELFAKLLSPVLACFVQDDGCFRSGSGCSRRPTTLVMVTASTNCVGLVTVSFGHGCAVARGSSGIRLTDLTTLCSVSTTSLVICGGLKAIRK